MKNILLLVGLLLIGCQSDQKSIHVNIYGELRQIMHGGVRDGVVALTDVLQDEHVYGLGALEGLEGEILIWDSKPVLTTAKKGGEASFTNNAENEKALLLVTATVKDWIEIPFNNTQIETSLNDYIYQIAKDNNINPEEPFPFILQGNFTKVKWHIISDPGPDGTHEDHMNKSWNRTVENTNAKILGFYSTKHHAVFTHHSTNSHMHFYDEKSGYSGHADELILGENTILKLPK
tara:strand:+ start:1607 stop:2308 length:702 start_codon:yes stop_codon:yes gene_type:complete